MFIIYIRKEYIFLTGHVVHNCTGQHFWEHTVNAFIFRFRTLGPLAILPVWNSTKTSLKLKYGSNTFIVEILMYLATIFLSETDVILRNVKERLWIMVITKKIHSLSRKILLLVTKRTPLYAQRFSLCFSNIKYSLLNVFTLYHLTEVLYT